MSQKKYTPKSKQKKNISKKNRDNLENKNLIENSESKNQNVDTEPSNPVKESKEYHKTNAISINNTMVFETVSKRKNLIPVIVGAMVFILIFVATATYQGLFSYSRSLRHTIGSSSSLFGQKSSQSNTLYSPQNSVFKELIAEDENDVIVLSECDLAFKYETSKVMSVVYNYPESPYLKLVINNGDNNYTNLSFFEVEDCSKIVPESYKQETSASYDYKKISSKQEFLDSLSLFNNINDQKWIDGFFENIAEMKLLTSKSNLTYPKDFKWQFISKKGIFYTLDFAGGVESNIPFGLKTLQFDSLAPSRPTVPLKRTTQSSSSEYSSSIPLAVPSKNRLLDSIPDKIDFSKNPKPLLLIDFSLLDQNKNEVVFNPAKTFENYSNNNNPRPVYIESEKTIYFPYRQGVVLRINTDTGEIIKDIFDFEIGSMIVYGGNYYFTEYSSDCIGNFATKENSQIGDFRKEGFAKRFCWLYEVNIQTKAQRKINDVFFIPQGGGRYNTYNKEISLIDQNKIFLRDILVLEGAGPVCPISEITIYDLKTGSFLNKYGSSWNFLNEDSDTCIVYSAPEDKQESGFKNQNSDIKILFEYKSKKSEDQYQEKASENGKIIRNKLAEIAGYQNLVYSYFDFYSEDIKIGDCGNFVYKSGGEYKSSGIYHRETKLGERYKEIKEIKIEEPTTYKNYACVK